MVMLQYLWIDVVTVLVALSAVIYAYVRRKINTAALLGTLALGAGIVITLGLRYSYCGLLVLLAFFLFGNLVTKYKYEKKAALGVAESNRGMRDINNVLGNGLSPLIFAISFAISHNAIFLIAFSGSVATACSDTFSTEIGQADGRPRLITTLKRVPVGTNGGVSLPGIGAALLGSALISLVSLTFPLNMNMNMNKRTAFTICLVSGFMGSLADSVFGATLEDRNPFKLNKHHVNILATLSGGIIAISIAYLLI